MAIVLLKTPLCFAPMEKYILDLFKSCGFVFSSTNAKTVLALSIEIPVGHHSFKSTEKR
jgi:hypothetical protein